jgi:DNA-nicking Smr family endonuclease
VPAKPVAKAKPAARAVQPGPQPKPIVRGPKPLADRGGEKRVRRGRLEIAATLDLHGHTQDSARAALGRFLASVPAPSTVLVVTGKGRAGQESVLRQRLPDWLASPGIRPLISGFAQAHPAHGGTGAFYIFVRRS